MENQHTYSQVAPKGSNRTVDEPTSEKYPYPPHEIWEMDKSDNLMYIEEIGIPFIKVDTQYHIKKWNQMFLDIVDVTKSELIYERLDHLADQSFVMEQIYDLMNQALQTGKVELTTFEDKESLIHLRALPLLEANAIYILLEDRSLQKQFENLLTFHHQMEAVSHIAAGVAHELRNPLSVIKGFFQLAQLTNEYQKYYDTILAELNRMNVIIEDFLSVSRRKMERKLQSPMHIMKSLVEIMKAECLLHNVEFSMHLKETPQFINVNESIIKQIMLNLLRNSIEAFGKSNNNRTFEIRTLIENEHYIIFVKDNGKGMPKEVLQQLGKPFFTTKETGTGIGIPLCKKMIEDHGGSFKIESTFNVGTTVILTIPLIEH
ncbi:two-component system sensor histidine kinase NtrB [Alkalihalobacillus sp. 1P02AB]|uniref:two-component system sensor histidine kinase NtrB n=1 Tax=Alkalihalobacillus sp. 1P02AB TaxID=3132260 RepID=UPI0039A66B99